jgi:hypothetical protein
MPVWIYQFWILDFRFWITRGIDLFSTTTSFPFHNLLFFFPNLKSKIQNLKLVRSIVELSLSPLFPRSYNSVYQAIQESFNTTEPKTNQEVTEEKAQKAEKEIQNHLMKVVSGLVDRANFRF